MGSEEEPAASTQSRSHTSILHPPRLPALAHLPILTGKVLIPHQQGCISSWQPFSIQPQLSSPIWDISCFVKITKKSFRAFTLLENWIFSDTERGDPFVLLQVCLLHCWGQWSCVRPSQPALGCKWLLKETISEFMYVYICENLFLPWRKACHCPVCRADHYTGFPGQKRGRGAAIREPHPN